MGNAVPQVAALTEKPKKTQKENKVLDDAQKLIRGKYAEQFSPARMADCMAMLRHDWHHFRASEGHPPPERLWLPHELASALVAKRGTTTMPSETSESAASSTVPASLFESSAPRAMKQVWHSMEAVCGLSRAEDIQHSYRTQLPRTVDAFVASPIFAGSTVVTRSAPKCALAKACPRVGELPFWVWRVLRVFQHGCPLPANSMHLRQAVTVTFEAHLHCPAEGEDVTCPMHPCWDEQPETQFLRTEREQEKRAKRDRAAKRERREKRDLDNHRAVVHVPVTCFLRPDNIIGGGFSLTATGRVPSLVQQHVMSVLHPATSETLGDRGDRGGDTDRGEQT